MPKKHTPGQYVVGYIRSQEPGRLRPSECGSYGVVKGKTVEQNTHASEWRNICQGALNTSKWVAYRIGPGVKGNGVDTEFLQACNTRDEAVEYIEDNHSEFFDERYE